MLVPRHKKSSPNNTLGLGLRFGLGWLGWALSLVMTPAQAAEVGFARPCVCGQWVHVDISAA